MRDRLTYRDAFLPSRKLGPIVRHRQRVVELAAIPKKQEAHRRNSLRARIDDHKGVAAPCSVAGTAREPAPEIDYGRSAHLGGERRTELKRIFEDREEHLTYALEP